MSVPSSQRVDHMATIIGPLLVGVLMLWLAGWTGEDQQGAEAELLATLATSLPWTLAWLAGAIGFGWPLRLALAPHANEGLAIQVGLGVAAMLTLDSALGTLGFLQTGGSLGACAITALGIVLLLLQLIRAARTGTSAPKGPAVCPPSWLIWTCAPAIAVLLTASCSAPGWLWATEFGGYDAMSYHLQLPKEWLAIGGIRPLDHNVYSFLPGYIEAAYYHLAVFIGDGIGAVYSCQLLHASMTILSAAVLYRLGRRINGPMAGCATALMFLGTPWVIVVGSLGYNEMVTVLMLAVGCLVLLEEDIASWKRGVIVGILAGAACGAKVTAAGFVAVPLIAALAIYRPTWDSFKAVSAAAIAGLVILLPYFVRNVTFSGNPVFPFFTGVFGLGHWTAEQAAIWTRGHVPEVSITNRLTELWNQFMRYGIGPNPDPPEPWKPQWSILPWLAAIGLIAGASVYSLRRVSVVIGFTFLVQILFWLLFTHLKSRFLIVASVPMCLAAATALTQAPFAKATERMHSLRYVVIVVLIAWVAQPVVIFLGEGRGAPAAAIGRAGELTGDDLTPQERLELGTTTFPEIAVNYLLPDDSKVLLIGDAAPLYYRRGIAYQSTWDRGPMSGVMRAHPDEPAKWAESLRTLGFTHVLIDETMLAIWESSGWNDLLITRERIVHFAQSHVQLMWHYPNGVTIYRVAD